MKTQKVEVLPFECHWRKQFLLIRDELETALGTTAIAIEHVGSTAVYGLCAKPIIDIDVVIKDQSDLPQAISKLEQAGYMHKSGLGIKNREAFSYKNKFHLMKHHLYVYCSDSLELKQRLAFRNHLKNNKQTAQEYSKIKREAAKLFWDDMDRYIKHRAPFIERIQQSMGL